MKHKIGILIMTVIMLTASCMSGCLLETAEPLPEYENEYFRYAVWTKKGEKTGYLVGFTELGLEQTELVLPQEIDGIPIVGFGYQKNMVSVPFGELKSENLKKWYIPFSLEHWGWDGYVNFENSRKVRMYDLRFSLGHGDDVISYVLYNQIRNGTTGNYTTYYSEPMFLANVSFMYNFDGAENGGYYWIDSYDNDLITFIPPEPQRAGFIFGDWYKDPECTNIWNFETDKTGDELPFDYKAILQGTTNPQYNETDGIKLYAKWVKN